MSGAGRLLGNLRKAISQPNEAWDYLRGSLVGDLELRLHGEYRKPSSKSVLDRSWDVLVVLDACRYDALAAENPFEAACEKRLSQAPNTEQWFEDNFGRDGGPPGEGDSDTDELVYVTANPMASSKTLDSDQFYHLEEVFKYGWDAADGSVHPDVVTRAALRLHEQYPEKRLVVHYMQPYDPFLDTDRPRLTDGRYAALRNGLTRNRRRRLSGVSAIRT